MSYNWITTPVAEWAYIKDPDVWNAHLAAVQERVDVVSPIGSVVVGIGGVALPVAAGTNIQSMFWWTSDTPPVSGSVYIGMQAISTYFTAFVDHRINFEGYTTPFFGDFSSIAWTMPKVRGAGALPNIVQLPPTINADPSFPSGYSTPNLAALPANSCWRRKRPREVFWSPFTFVTDYAFHLNFDIQSNAAAVGQLGWLVDDGGVLNPSPGYTYGSWLFSCTATGTHGTWTRVKLTP